MLKTELASSYEGRWHFPKAPDTPLSELWIQKWGPGWDTDPVLLLGSKSVLGACLLEGKKLLPSLSGQ